jgi:hypothetical protein
MWQDLLVYLIVSIAALYASWRWMPIVTRASIVSRAILFAKRWGLSSESAMKWQTQASAKTGCGSCGPCKACNTTVTDNRPGEVAQG